MQKGRTSNTPSTTKAHVIHRVVADDDDGCRLDRWLQRHFATLPRDMAGKLYRTGQIRVDGKRARGDTRLGAGQTLRLPPQLSVLPAETPKPPPADSQTLVQKLSGLILFQNHDLIAINKPAGLAVQGGMGIDDHLDGWLQAWAHHKKQPLKLVHRLDRDTSGLLLLAKGARAANTLAAMFRDKNMHKVYWAVVHGKPPHPQGVISAPLIKRGETMAVAKPGTAGAQAATTRYVVLHTTGDYSWLELQPETGRTHQLRVHCLHMGCPIVGDPLYGRKKFPLTDAQKKAGLHLHAVHMVFSLD
ncbi:MAG: RluA family pseudouridine synthase, partial [Alphaproteobacteria bacterium]|nr:RluA family pseudouridine synthase [Alphaproteobacteria bacterium]